jgi:hypothetical protein
VRVADDGVLLGELDLDEATTTTTARAAASSARGAATRAGLRSAIARRC